MSDPLRSPGFWLQHAALSWRAQLEERLRRFGLTHAQFTVLATIGWLEQADGTSPPQRQLAEHAGTDRQLTDKVVRTLRDRGLVARAHGSYGRTLHVRLTVRGRAVATEAAAVASALDDELFGPDAAEFGAMIRTVAERRVEDARRKNR